jgi:hypothetical protein
MVEHNGVVQVSCPTWVPLWYAVSMARSGAGPEEASVQVTVTMVEVVEAVAVTLTGAKGTVGSGLGVIVEIQPPAKVITDMTHTRPTQGLSKFTRDLRQPK